MAVTYKLLSPAADMITRAQAGHYGRGPAANFMAVVNPIDRRKRMGYYEKLRAADRDGLRLSKVNYLRLFDAPPPGSSNDLVNWRSSFSSIPAITSVADFSHPLGDWRKFFANIAASCSNLPVAMSVHAADDPDTIVLNSPAFGVNNETWDFNKNPKVPQGPTKYAPFFVLGNKYGLRGIRVEVDDVSAIARCGGMESSNAFGQFIREVAPVLAGVTIGSGEAFWEMVNDATEIYGDITGGQGTLTNIFGGWHLFSIRSDGAVIATELIPPLHYQNVLDHVILLQPGKDFSGRTKRQASDTNAVWCNANRTPGGFAGNSRISDWCIEGCRALAAAAAGDEEAWKEVARITMLQADWRYKLTPQYILGNEALSKEVVGMGGFFFALGAGGPETMVSVGGPRHVAEYIRNRFPSVTEAEARDILEHNGFLRGRFDVKINPTGAVWSDDWKKAGFGPLPSRPLEVTADELLKIPSVL